MKYYQESNKYYPEETDRAEFYPKSTIVKHKPTKEFRPALHEFKNEYLMKNGIKWKQPNRKVVN